MAKRGKQSPPRKGRIEVGLTAARRQAALAAFAECPVYARVADSLDVHPRTFDYWREKHPDFQEELDRIRDGHVRRRGQLAELAIDKALGGYVDGVPDWREVPGEDGPVRIHSAPDYPGSAVRSALTKYDPDYVRVPLTKEEKDKVAGFIQEMLEARGKT